ncbi:response regulator [Mesorhizobium sp. CN2-181]|uniref:response regulator n=1 Tax=Mesorhizobium yinganensis TaxID=3157707 RepID=UPI0032B70ACB
MTMTTSGHEIEPENCWSDEPMAEGASAGPLMVLLVGRSRINAVVVSRIVQRSGLHSISEPPERAADVLASMQPALVILDGGSKNADCEDLMPSIRAMRRTVGRPAVILLSTGNFAEITPAYADIVDAVVSKPILPELLQPIVDRLVGRDPA